MKIMFVYILKCSDNSYYVGVTNDIERRIAEHESGTDRHCYTFARRPVKLVYHQNFTDPEHAIALEKQLKGWSRAKKEALINGDIDLLKKLSKSGTQGHSSSGSE